MFFFIIKKFNSYPKHKNKQYFE